MFPGWKFYIDKHGGKEHRRKLKSIEFLILSHINAEGPINGYNVMISLRKQFKDLWNPSPGTVYNQLDNLEKKGLITYKLVDTDKEHSKSKEFFLTQKGKEVLKNIVTVETAEKEFKAIGDYIKTVMQKLPFDERIGPFYQFLGPLFESLEPPRHPPPRHSHRHLHPPPPGASPTPDYNHFIDAMRDFKHVCVNYCKCDEDEKQKKLKEKRETHGVNIPVKDEFEE